METWILIIVVLLGFIFLKSKSYHTLAATADDWFVIFDIDAEYRVISLWFYPIVGLSFSGYKTTTVTSNPAETKRLQSARKEHRVNDGLFGLSYSYGRWFRDGVSFDENGKAEYLDASDFATYLSHYLVGEFRIRYATPIPTYYQTQIQVAHKLAKQEP